MVKSRWQCEQNVSSPGCHVGRERYSFSESGTAAPPTPNDDGADDGADDDDDDDDELVDIADEFCCNCAVNDASAFDAPP